MISRVIPNLAVTVLLLGGCQTPASSPYRSADPARRDSIRAQALTQEAADLINEDPLRAETLLRDALAADLYHGPAHNNLGAIFLKQGRLYEAASEFEWARKLMPGDPDPRMNLALALERGGRVDEALATYRTALEVYPNHLPTLQALARCQLRYGAMNDHTLEYLGEIALRSDDVRWRDWARLQLLRIDRSQSSAP